MLLRTTPFAESDLIVQLFTADHGKVSALARGARKSQRRFAGALGLLVVASYQLRPRPRADLWTLESATVVREWTALAADVAAVAHASYAVELVRELTPAEQPEPDVLALLIELHDALAARGPSPSLLRAFELRLLEVIGSAPSLDRCIACGARDAIDAPGTVFDPGRGGVACARCAPGCRGTGIRPLPATARSYLVAVRQVDSLADAAVHDDDVDAAHDRAIVRDCLVGMIVGLIGHPLRTVEFIAKMRAHP